MKPGHIALGVAIAIVWGFNFVVADSAVAHLPPFLLVVLRYAVVAVLFLPFTRRGGLPWRYIIPVGLLYGVVQFSGLFLGLRLGVSAGVAATLIQTQAAITVVLARLVLKERFAALQWAGLTVGAVGLVLIAASGGASAPLLGVVCVLIGAAGWAGSNIVLKRAKGVSAWTMTVWQSVAVIPPMLLLSGIFESGQPRAIVEMQPLTILAVLYIAVVATGFGNYAWYRLMQQVGPAKGAPFSLLIPVVGLVAGWLVLGEQLTGLQIAGVLVTMAGLAVIIFGPQLVGMLRRLIRRPAVTTESPSA